jgi:hypothetical protein
MLIRFGIDVECLVVSLRDLRYLGRRFIRAKLKQGYGAYRA